MHQMDQQKLTAGVVKKYFLIEKQADIIPTIYEAYEIATSGEPGPVFVEIPVEVQMFQAEVKDMPVFIKKDKEKIAPLQQIKEAAKLLALAKKPGLYVGWGAVDASDAVTEIAESLNAPVSTTLQGISSFSGDHPLHTCLGFGNSATPAGQKAFKNCDVMLAVAVRFSELATGSFGVEVPENLIHIDINPEVFDKNYPTKIAIEGDAAHILKVLAAELALLEKPFAKKNASVKELIAKEKEKYFKAWRKKKSETLVSPGFFFKALREKLPDDAQMIMDDGKHTFLTAELFPVRKPRHMISPTDFNSMGYCVPACIGAKIANPNKTTVGIVGDGAFMMTGFELITANTLQAGIVIFVFHDGELGQISQFQKIPLNRKTATVIGSLDVSGVAKAVGAHYLRMNNDLEIGMLIDEALEVSSKGIPVLVDVNIDYSQKTMLTKGVIKSNLSRFSTKEKVRFISRAVKRHLLG